MSMAVGGKQGLNSDINMTPMIDVLLVLIIIFMVITPEVSNGLDVVAPQPSNTPAPAIVVSREMVITVAKDGAIDINHQPVAPGTLGSRLAELYGRHINDHVFVRGDRDLEFQAVAQVIDAARGAGWGRIGLMTR